MRKRFSNLVEGLEVDEGAFAQEIEARPPAHQNYVILFTARSGSTWLSSVLGGTKLLGYPHEYINPAFVRGIAKATNSRDQRGIIAILRRRRQTRNGIFGIEITSMQLGLYGEAEFFEAFEKQPLIFNLWRDNIVAQGISLYRAVVTKRFHSSDPPMPPPAYDAKQIARWVRQVGNVENNNWRLLRRRSIRAKSLRYEDIIQNRARTINIFAKALGVAIPRNKITTSYPNELQKIGDNWNCNAEIRFRAEQAELIAEIEDNRLIKRRLRHKQVPVEAQSD